MENHDLDPMTVLKVKKIHHCQKCYKTLKKKLLSVKGVYKVSVDQEKKLVSVRGKVDPSLLIKAIKEIGNTAELLSYQKEPKKMSYSESTERERGESMQKNGREKKNHGFSKGKESNKEEEEHKAEDYEPPKTDTLICKDPYCKQHKRRPIITSSVPSRDNEKHPHHTGMGFPPGTHQLFHQTNPLQYCDYPPEAVAPPAYRRFYSGRPMPFTSYGYGDGNSSDYTVMYI